MPYFFREWRRWFGSPEPERASLPGDWQNRLDALQRLVVIRCLRPDRVIPAASRFVSDAMDTKFVESAPLDWEELIASSKNSVPLLFILSGVDPIGQVVSFATSRNITVCLIFSGGLQLTYIQQCFRLVRSCLNKSCFYCEYCLSGGFRCIGAGPGLACRASYSRRSSPWVLGVSCKLSPSRFLATRTGEACRGNT